MNFRTSAVGLFCAVTAASSAHAQGQTQADLPADQQHVASSIAVADVTGGVPAPPGQGYSNPRYQAPSGSQFDGVARLLMYSNGQPYSGCTGTLLNNGHDVLTAAHCVSALAGNLPISGVQVGFLTSSGLTNYHASSWTVMPGYTGAVVDPNDLAVIHLDTGVDPSIPRYALYGGGDPLGATVDFVGFGLTGNGITGGVVSTQFNDLFYGTTPVRRFGENTWDATFNGSTVYSWYNTPIMLSDFDNGSTSKNFLCQLFGGPAVAGGYQVCNSGYGINEVEIGSGDSGGPGMIWNPATNRWEVAGVASFGSQRCFRLSDSTTVTFNPNGTCPSGYARNGSYFGSYAGHVSVASGQQALFVASITAPEPSSLALLGTGLLGIVPMLRRRTS